MRDVEISNDPADYMSGPRGGSPNNGGTNRSGGVSVTQADEAPTPQPSQPAPEQPPAPPAQ